jgi:hypothetical protein
MTDNREYSLVSSGKTKNSIFTHMYNYIYIYIYILQKKRTKNETHNKIVINL